MRLGHLWLSPSHSSQTKIWGHLAGIRVMQRSAWLLLSETTCSVSCSRHSPTEGPSLTFQIRTKLSIKLLRSKYWNRGDLSILCPLPTSEESNTLIHQISQTEATNLFCFVWHVGPATSSYYALSGISLVISPSLNKFTERAGANNPGMQVLVYLCAHLVMYQSIPKAFPEELHKK